MLPITLLAAALTVPAPAFGPARVCQAADGPPASLEVGPENFEAWGEFIRPSAKERRFEQIGWRNEFWPAILEARELGRPVLLWTMNGHPLGCT
ncbi:MAG: hypothetical protein E2O39_08540 [Planctomycetota bacterium]|nr:MAG: hypothetical protein E2O39_08540 [Planctomycetota bacterium]